MANILIIDDNRTLCRMLGEMVREIGHEAEKRYFRDLMALTRGSIKEACRISGLGRTRLYTLMKKHGISRPGWPG